MKAVVGVGGCGGVSAAITSSISASRLANPHYSSSPSSSSFSFYSSFLLWSTRRSSSSSLMSLPPIHSSAAAASSSFSSSNSLASTSATMTTTTTTRSNEKEGTSNDQQRRYPWLIVGLGNPGKKYNGTRHNVGFDMVDAIADAEGIPITTVSCKALFGKGYIGNVPVMLAKPQTFMNASGVSVAALVSYYKIPLKQVLVIYDDLDLPFAKLRLLPKGGYGGHNGMRSIIDHLKGSRDFPRLRFGIGRPPGKMDTVNFVLRSFTKQEREELEFTFQQGIQAVRILLLEGLNKSATFVNTAKPMEQLS